MAEVYERAARMPNIAIRGVQMHIGSQITEAAPFAEAIAKVTPLIRELKERYRPRILQRRRRDWDRLRIVVCQRQRRLVERKGPRASDDGSPAHDPRLRCRHPAAVARARTGVLLEPGRLLVGNAGVLLTRVRYIKEAEHKKFVIVDAGMNDLIRPALYQSYHEIVPVREAQDSAREPVDVVGPVCESGDFFAQDGSCRK